MTAFPLRRAEADGNSDIRHEEEALLREERLDQLLYFTCAPARYRKLLVVQRSLRGPETLAEHFLKRYRHLVPSGVELWEFDPVARQGRVLHKSRDE